MQPLVEKTAPQEVWSDDTTMVTLALWGPFCSGPRCFQVADKQQAAQLQTPTTRFADFERGTCSLEALGRASKCDTSGKLQAVLCVATLSDGVMMRLIEHWAC